MTNREVMQQALEALVLCRDWPGAYDECSQAVTALRKALEQPEQRKPLTASEILNMMPSTIPAEHDGALMEFARAIEAKLKEKNNA